MGGDCDGNLFVIFEVICKVFYMNCWKVVDFFLCDISNLVEEFLVVYCMFEFCEKYGDYIELYCVVVKGLCSKL